MGKDTLTIDVVNRRRFGPRKVVCRGREARTFVSPVSGLKRQSWTVWVDYRLLATLMDVVASHESR